MDNSAKLATDCSSKLVQAHLCGLSYGFNLVWDFFSHIDGDLFELVKHITNIMWMN